MVGYVAHTHGSMGSIPISAMSEKLAKVNPKAGVE